MTTIFKKLAVLAVGLILLGAMVVAAFFAAMVHHFHPPAPRLPTVRAVSVLEAQRQNIRYFRQLIVLDRSFSAAARQEANRRLGALEALGAVLDRPHLLVALMSIDALADNGHSRVEDDGRTSQLELPVRVVAFSDGLFVMRASEGHKDLLGSRVMTIDGQSIDAVMTKLEQLRGGVPQWRRLLASEYLTSQTLLYGIDVARDPLYSDWIVETPAGAVISRRLGAFAPPVSEPTVPATRWLSSERLVGQAEEWRSMEPDQVPPLSLTRFDTAFRSLPVPGTCTHFVQLKSNADQGGQKIKAFLSDTERELRRIRPCSVIVDLRYDSGGDYLNTYGFARKVSSLISPEGKVIVLTGPATFSAGITTAAFVKHADPQRVLILGEPVGDRLQFYAEGGRACLPNEPICVAYETGKHDYQHACTDWDVCFWLNYFVELRVKSLAPDEIIPLSFKDWRRGVDPVLNRALALAATRSSRKTLTPLQYHSKTIDELLPGSTVYRRKRPHGEGPESLDLHGYREEPGATFRYGFEPTQMFHYRDVGSKQRRVHRSLTGIRTVDIVRVDADHYRTGVPKPLRHSASEVRKPFEVIVGLPVPRPVCMNENRFPPDIGGTQWQRVDRAADGRIDAYYHAIKVGERRQR